MSVKFKAIVDGDIPSNRLVVLDGRTDENIIKVRLADKTSGCDFVATQDLKDKQEITVILKDGEQVWEVEAEKYIPAGAWVSVGADGKVGMRKDSTLENVGYTISQVDSNGIAKVLRRTRYEATKGQIIDNELKDLKARLTELESKNV